MSLILLFVSGAEIFVILLIILLVFGADKMPQIFRSLGKGMREFHKASNEIKQAMNESGMKEDIEEIKSNINNNPISKNIKEIKTKMNN